MYFESGGRADKLGNLRYGEDDVRLTIRSFICGQILYSDLALFNSKSLTILFSKHKE